MAGDEWMRVVLGCSEMLHTPFFVTQVSLRREMLPLAAITLLLVVEYEYYSQCIGWDGLE